MKKVKIPFSLSEYEKGDYKVETKHEHHVRIAFTDVAGKRPIVALIEQDGEENVYKFDSNGKRFGELASSNYDLMLVKIEYEDGDFVWSHNGLVPFVSILRGSVPEKYGDCDGDIDCYATFFDRDNYGGTLRMYSDAPARHIRIATADEAQSLIDELAKRKELKWNPKMKNFDNVITK